MTPYALTVIAALEAITDGALIHRRNCYLMQIRCALEEGAGVIEACDRAVEWLAEVAKLSIDNLAHIAV